MGTTAPRRFRGGSAPASLKPLVTRQGHLLDAQFPGRIRPGLIEACRRNPLRRLLRRGFRGGSAPASLKRTGRTRRPRPHPPFPGRIRPGLIEAANSIAMYFAALEEFPGRIRPGLIEARPIASKLQ